MRQGHAASPVIDGPAVCDHLRLCRSRQPYAYRFGVWRWTESTILASSKDALDNSSNNLPFQGLLGPSAYRGFKRLPAATPFYEAFRPHVSPIRLLAHWHIFGPALGIQRLLRQPDPAQNVIIATPSVFLSQISLPIFRHTFTEQKASVSLNEHIDGVGSRVIGSYFSS
jgi:hypothetical protein